MRIVENYPPEMLELFQHIERKWRDRLRQGVFYAEGEQVFASLLHSQITISAALITPDLLEKYRSLIEPRDLEAIIADKGTIERFTQRRLNQGVIALARVPEMRRLESIVAEGGCIVALNGIGHAVNVGSILRNCAAFGASAVIFDEATIHPYCWRAIKASMGGVFHVPIYSAADLLSLLKMLRENGFMLIAADPSGRSIIGKLKSSRGLCLILGNEHGGISTGILDLQPERVAIPMKGVNSLNVASASAIFLHQISILSGNGQDG
jgi:TrmH family RNA methyltransferase